MPTPSHPIHRSFLAVAVCAMLAATAFARDETAPDPPAEPPMTHHASGPFDVKMIPQQPSDGAPESIGRMLLDKRYHGDLEGTGQGQFLGFRSAVEGSAGYVAMELVVGSLAGRSGSFVLQHSGTMDRGDLGLTLTVVPDSGTGELTGLSGSMQIVIEQGEHSYKFDYALP